jgi:predicted metal-dependent phosphoesterase TrpH
VKVELHSHTSRYSSCSNLTPEALVRCLIANKYDAVYMTEHDVMWSPDEVADLQGEYPEILIFTGVELTIERCHLQVLGTFDKAFLEIDDPAEIITKASEDGCATILAHPLRWPRGDEILACGVLPDALECGTPNHDAFLRQRAIKVCEQLDLAPVFADDAHNEEIIGSYWIDTAEPLVKASDIQRVLRERTYTPGMRGVTQ